MSEFEGALVSILVLVFFSVLAFWKENVFMFMLVAGLSAIMGFTWWDSMKNDTGLTISLLLWGYSFVNAGFVLKCIFFQKKVEGNE